MEDLRGLPLVRAPYGPKFFSILCNFLENFGKFYSGTPAWAGGGASAPSYWESLIHPCHVIIAHDAWDLIVKGNHPPILEMAPIPTSAPLLVTSGGHHWRPVHFFSFKDPPYPFNRYWHLLGSYWNAFWFRFYFHRYCQ